MSRRTTLPLTLLVAALAGCTAGGDATPPAPLAPSACEEAPPMPDPCTTLRVEVAIETPEGERVGQATWRACMVEVLGYFGHDTPGGEPRRQAEAVYVDLGARGHAVALLRDDHGQDFPTRALIALARHARPDVLPPTPYTLPAGTRLDLPPDTWPLVVDFADPTDWRSARPLYRSGTGSPASRRGKPPDEDRFEERFGPGVRLARVTVEIVDGEADPPTLRQRLPLLDAPPDTRLGPLIGRHRLRRTDLASTLDDSLNGSLPEGLTVPDLRGYGPARAVTLQDPGAEPRRAIRFEVPAGEAATTRWRREEEGTLEPRLPFGVRAERLGLRSESSRATSELLVRRRVLPAEPGHPLPVQLVLDGSKQEGRTMRDPRSFGQRASQRRLLQSGPGGAPMPVLLDPQSGDLCPFEKRLQDVLALSARPLLDPWLLAQPHFPRTPLGVGARWTVERTLQVGDEQLDVVQHHTLTAHDGDQVTIELTRTVRRPEDASPTLLHEAPVGRFELLDYRGEGAGELVTDLRTMAVTGAVQTTWALELQIAPNELPLTIPVTVNVDERETFE